MQTELDPKFQNSAEGMEAKKIVQQCVHCGFCNATCPTYLETGDERDGPRGRIYLIKAMLEGNDVSEKSRVHFDRCLTCRNCETTCPSGVQYGQLIDIGRNIAEKASPRSFRERCVRWGLLQILPYASRFGFLLKLGQGIRPVLPYGLKKKVPPKVISIARPNSNHARFMVALAGCAQSSATPNTNAAAARVLDKLGISLVEVAEAGCCGAVHQHLAEPEKAREFIRRNIDAWWPWIEKGAEAILSLASGCGVMIKDYGRLLKNDPQYSHKAEKISALFKDIGEVLLNEDLSSLNVPDIDRKVALHCPCTLQHGLKQPELIDAVLAKLNIRTTRVNDRHLCCGSAGTYSILQSEMSQKLLQNKLAALMVDDPDMIVTANVGCQLHLQSRASVPVKHWIELLT